MINLRLSNFCSFLLSVFISFIGGPVVAEEYELVGLIFHASQPEYYLPFSSSIFKLNEKSEVVVSSFYVSPSGTFSTLAVVDPQQHFLTYSLNSISNESKIAGTFSAKSGVIQYSLYPLTDDDYGDDYLNYPFSSSEKSIFDNPISVLDENNIVGECFDGAAGAYFSASACGYVNGVFKTFNLSLNTDNNSSPYLTQYYQSANAINSSGVVVGEAIANYASSGGDQNSNALRAFSWTNNGGMLDLGTLGGKRSAAKDINNSNLIVGYSEDVFSDDAVNKAFYKTALGGMTGLNIPTQVSSVANAVNDSNTIVGTVTTSQTESYAFVKYGADSSAVTDLNNLVHPLFSSFKLSSATDINNHGEIVGKISNSNYFSGYIARLLPENRRPFPFSGGRSARGTADFLVWRPSHGSWYALRPKLENNLIVFTDTLVKQWGLPNDIPMFGADFDGDKIDDLVVWRPSNGTWYSCLSSASYDCTKGTSTQFGLPGDIPIIGDYDADGKSDYAVFRRSLPSAGIIGTWYIKRSSDGVITSKQWGLQGDYPLQGDFNGDGYADFAVFRPSTATWFIYYSNQATGQNKFLSKQFGLPGDHPLPRDIDADGVTDILVYRPSSSVWYTCSSIRDFSCFKSDGSLVMPSFAYGLPGDIPVKRNVFGGETEQFSIWRPSDTYYNNEGGWYTHMIAGDNNVAIKHWGLKSDIPAGVGIRDLLLMTKQESVKR